VTTYSHSELATFRRCPREHYYRYILGRESTAPKSDALTKGRQIDRAIELGVTDDMAPEIRALVAGHEAYWGNTAKHAFGGGVVPTTETHVRFRFEFSLGVELVGEVDGLEVDGLSSTLIYERKSTSESIEPGSPYWERVTRTDPQVSLYLAAGQALGWGATGVLYDVLRKPALRKSEAKSRKAPETDAEFEARVLEDISKRPEHYYQRQTITRTDSELREWESDVRGTIHLMQVPDRPRNVDACFKFGSPCEYYLVCGHGADIQDETLYRTRETSEARKNVGDRGAARRLTTTPAVAPIEPGILCAWCGKEVGADERVRTWLSPFNIGWRHKNCSPLKVPEPSNEDMIPFDEVVDATERNNRKRYFR
jgi:hypothetical protein